jgi:hypothetical protein
VGLMLSRRLRRYLIWGVIAAGLVGLYAAGGFWGVPRLIRSSLQSFVTTHYHRKVSVGEILFNPFNLRLEVRDFSLPDGDAQPMLGFDYLRIELRIASLWRRAPSFRAIELERPFGRVLIRRCALRERRAPRDFQTEARAHAPLHRPLRRGGGPREF